MCGFEPKGPVVGPPPNPRAPGVGAKGCDARDRRVGGEGGEEGLQEGAGFIQDFIAAGFISSLKIFSKKIGFQSNSK